MWSGRPISGPRSPHLEQGRGVGVGGGRARARSRTCSCTPEFTASKFVCRVGGSDASASSGASAGCFINLLNSCQITLITPPPLPQRQCVASHRHRKAFKENTFPELFIYSSLCAPPPPPPHATLVPFIRPKGADICFFFPAPFDCFRCRQRRRQGRGLACGRANFTCFVSICGRRGNAGQTKLVGEGV